MNVDIDNFLVQSYAKQIKELNSSTGKEMLQITIHMSTVHKRKFNNSTRKLFKCYHVALKIHLDFCYENCTNVETGILEFKNPIMP